MKIKILLIVLLINLLPSVEAFAFTLPTGKITVKITDKSDNPIEGMPVLVGFPVPAKAHRGISGVAVKGFSDANGFFVAEHESMDYVNYVVEKQGYYKSSGRFNFGRSKSGKWQPWNPTVELVVRKIENPVPMYARNTKQSKIEIPESGKEIGFDLIAYDWVSPYGKGKIADFIFKLEKQYVDDRNFSSKLIITFTNKFDGIQVIKENLKYGSEFKLPRFAPEDGYQKELIKFYKRRPGKFFEDNFEEDNNYIFRIRSEVEDGKLVRAMYGKIQGDIKQALLRSKTARITFKYYLNPDYTRNLEFDPKQNLFRDLPDRERVDLN